MSSTVRHLNIDPEEAAAALVFSLGWAVGQVPVYVDGGVRPAFLVRDGAEAWRRVHEMDLRSSREFAVGLPADRGMVGSSTVLWAWTASRDSLFRASRFQPAPSLVLRFGRGAARLCLWMLRDPLGFASIQPHNERISYALHAPRVRCVPEKLRVPLPGTFLRKGRPVPVLVTRLEPVDFSLGQVTGGLKDPPPKDAWRQRRAA